MAKVKNLKKKKALLKTLKELLTKIKEKDFSTITTRQGICWYLDNEEVKDNEILFPLFESWESFSGSWYYPIPYKDDSISPSQYFRDNENLWKGRQLKMRKSLIKHMIAELEKELK